MSGTNSATIVLSVALAALVFSAAGGARSQAPDLQFVIGVGPPPVGNPTPGVPNGGTATVRGPKFVVGVNLELTTSETGSARFTLELPAGLAWGADLPDPSESCTSTPSTAECTGPAGSSWGWDVVAAQAGTYVVKGGIVETTPPDATPANNSSSITIVVLPAATASAVTLSPAAPRAGTAFAATVRVTAGGEPLKPSALTCRATLRGASLNGSARVTSGLARCTFRTPRSAKGKVLRGSMAFNAGGTLLIRRFSTKLR